MSTWAYCLPWSEGLGGITSYSAIFQSSNDDFLPFPDFLVTGGYNLINLQNASVLSKF